MNAIPSGSNRLFAGCISMYVWMTISYRGILFPPKFHLLKISERIRHAVTPKALLRIACWVVPMTFYNRSPWIYQKFQGKGTCIKLCSPFALLTSCLRTPGSGQRMVSHKASPASIVSLGHTFEHKEWKIRSTPTVLQTPLCLSVGQEGKES